MDIFSYAIYFPIPYGFCQYTILQYNNNHITSWLRERHYWKMYWCHNINKNLNQFILISYSSSMDFTQILYLGLARRFLSLYLWHIRVECVEGLLRLTIFNYILLSILGSTKTLPAREVPKVCLLPKFRIRGSTKALFAIFWHFRLPEA